MVLLRQLLLRQFHDRDHLLRQRFRDGETLREHHDLGDERKVGHHHRNRPHDSLQVIRKLRSAGVTRVHRDENPARRNQPNSLPLEEEGLRPGLDRGHDDANLRRHHREHLNRDAVELVEARPSAGLRQPAKHLRRHLVIDAVGAVEDDDVPCECLAEVLHGLRLAGTRGSERVAAAAGEQRGSQSHVTPIRQRRHHQPPVVALVLVPVRKHGEHLLDHAVVLFLVPVEPELRDPLEIRRGFATAFGEFVD